MTFPKGGKLMIKMCAWCGDIRDEEDRWKKAVDISQNLSVKNVTHGICPKCLAKVNPESFRALRGSNHGDNV